MVGEANNRWREERAVSPVIGVILMVAIVVILAAIIGAFVLGINEERQTVPAASIVATDEPPREHMMWDGHVKRVARDPSLAENADDTLSTCDREHTPELDHRNNSTNGGVSIEHRGGEALQQQNIQINVESTNGTEHDGDDVVAAGIGFDTKWPGWWTDRFDVGSGPNDGCDEGWNDTTHSVTQPLWNDNEKSTIQVNEEVLVEHWIKRGLTLNSPGGNREVNYTSTALIVGERQCPFMYGNHEYTGDRMLLYGFMSDDADENDNTAYALPVAVTEGMTSPEEYTCNLKPDAHHSYAEPGEPSDEGVLYEDDEVKVVWSPPESDQSQVLANHKVE